MDTPIQNPIITPVTPAPSVNVPTKTYKRSSFPRFGHDPHVDWLYLILLFLLVILIGVIVGVSTYSSVGSRLSQPTEPSEMKSSAGIDTKGLQAVLDEFENRSAESATLMRGYIGVGDPSL